MYCLQMERGLSTMYVKSKWEKEANTKLTEDDWLNIKDTDYHLKLRSVEGIYPEKHFKVL